MILERGLGGARAAEGMRLVEARVELPFVYEGKPPRLPAKPHRFKEVSILARDVKLADPAKIYRALWVLPAEGPAQVKVEKYESPSAQ